MASPKSDRTLLEMATRLDIVVTELNGLISLIVNDEISLADCNGDLAQLFQKLAAVEATVEALADQFYQ